VSSAAPSLSDPSAGPVRLRSGDRAPEFTLPTDDGSVLSLSDLRGQRVVLYAYPAAMTSGCTTQACDFRDSLGALHAAGITVVGISPDDSAKLAEFRQAEALTYALVSTRREQPWSPTARTARDSATGRPSPG